VPSNAIDKVKFPIIVFETLRVTTSSRSGSSEGRLSSGSLAISDIARGRRGTKVKSRLFTPLS